MMTTTSEYPRVDVLRRGVVLRAVVNATMVAREPDLARFLSWDGNNYVLNNADGTYGAITFEGASIVGVFFDSQSSYNPYVSKGAYDRDQFFRGMPPNLRSIAENQTLKYNRQNDQGQSVALVTAAFWSDGDYLTAAFSWPEVFRNGAHIVSAELTEDTEEALKEWQDEYQCSPEEISFARSLFERRMADPSRAIVLSGSEVLWLQRRSKDSQAFADCLKALRPLNILPPRQ